IFQSGRGSVRRVGSTALVDGLACDVHAVDEELCVQDYDVEIAHGSVIYGPIITPITVGLEASVRASRVPAGFILAWAIRGKALWIPCAITTHAGPFEFVLEARIVGARRPATVVLEAGANSSERAIVPAGSFPSDGFWLPELSEQALLPDYDADESWPSKVV